MAFVQAGGVQINTYEAYAAADLAEGSRELSIYCPQLLPFVSGNIKATEQDNDIKTQGGQGYSYQGKVKTKNFITAQYRDETSNRVGPPNIRKGEQVILYNYGDTDQWYWKSSGRNDNLRRTETLRMGISGNTANNAGTSDQNSYMFEMDTRNSHRILLSTSGTDGEKHRYVILIDADNSKVQINDEAGNQFYISSEEHVVGLKNQDNSVVILDKKNITIAADGDITICSKQGQIRTQSAKDTTITADGNITQETKQNLTQNASQNYSLGYHGSGSTNSHGGTFNITSKVNITG